MWALDQGMAEADEWLDQSYYAHYAQHCPIEPHVAFRLHRCRGALVIVTSTQVPFHVRRIVAQCLEIPVRRSASSSRASAAASA
jgi:putative selenate reductase molybdopterin-binding subunit